jgi:hypothetical protein
MILIEKGSSILVNVSVGSEIQVIASMFGLCHVQRRCHDKIILRTILRTPEKYNSSN